MNIRILGAHRSEFGNKKNVCLLIDGVLALDAGALTSSLSVEEQCRLKGVLITHAHYDHIRDIPTLAINLYSLGKRIDVYATESMKKTIESHLLNNDVYPDYFKLPPNKPTLKYTQIVPGNPQMINGYSVLPVRVNHGGGALGYQLSNGNGKTICYTGDTGPGFPDVWARVEPQIILTEVTFPNRCKEFALQTGHLTPDLLYHELVEYRRIREHLPTVIAIHMDPVMEREIEEELALLSQTIDTRIIMAYEGLAITL